MSDLSKRGPKEAKFLNTTAFSFEDGCMHPLLKIDGCNCTRTDEDPVLRLGLILVFEYIRVINLKTRVYSKLEYLKSTSLYSSLKKYEYFELLTPFQLQCRAICGHLFSKQAVLCRVHPSLENEITKPRYH